MGIKLKEEGKGEREEKGERRKRDKVLGKMYSRTDLVPRTTSFASSSRVKNMNSSSPCMYVWHAVSNDRCNSTRLL